MIRINLIQTPGGEAETKAAAPSGELWERKEFIPLAVLIFCLAVTGLLYWGYSHRIATLNRQLVSERQQAARLKVIEAQNKHYQSEIDEIDQHINVIQTLQKNRTGPRDLMTLLGNAADRVSGLYLLSVDNQNGRISIKGQSDNLDAVADFIAALESVNSFNSVLLRQVFEADESTRVSFKFDLDCLYKPPVEVAVSTPPAPPSGGAGRPPGR